jgi:hypothetical protein
MNLTTSELLQYKAAQLGISAEAARLYSVFPSKAPP